MVSGAARANHRLIRQEENDQNAQYEDLFSKVKKGKAFMRYYLHTLTESRGLVVAITNRSPSDARDTAVLLSHGWVSPFPYRRPSRGLYAQSGAHIR